VSDQHGDQTPPTPAQSPAAPETTQPLGEQAAAASHASEVSHASKQEDPSAQAEGLGDDATGDIVIDSALQDLQAASADDLDAQIEAGQRVHQTLHGRLSDLGGE
jgi:DNA polymerase-3 subunit gamma/tau